MRGVVNTRDASMGWDGMAYCYKEVRFRRMEGDSLHRALYTLEGILMCERERERERDGVR